VLTLNTHKGFTPFNRRFVLHELRDAVRTLSADVVFLQEVLGSHDGHSVLHPNWPTAPQYEFLADSIWTDFAYGRNAVYTQGHHGNALLSKFPILRYENHDISIAGPERRGLLHCVLKVAGPRVEVHTICTHLSLSEPHRRQQLNLMCELVNDAIPDDVPLLIAGDFNDWRLRAHSLLDRCARLKEAFVVTHGKAARTFPARWPLLRLDRIYFRNLRVRNSARHSARPWSHLSDHVALTAEVCL
jgi:endonuclease/exonuclease/phosphatase family metal-dependent hydrolase